MATVVPQLLTKGPLSSALGQWLALGLGSFVLLTGDNGVSSAFQSVASTAYKLVTGGHESITDSMIREALLANKSFQAQLHAQLQNALPQHEKSSTAPIVIHTQAGGRGWTAALVQVGAVGGGIWAVYVLASSYLPEGVREMMPVTRHFFDKSVGKLATGILKVREALALQIASLSGKQDELSAAQAETHSEVLNMRDDLGDVRVNVDDIASAINRCESSLDDAAGRQTYMSRGVRLLVQCVGDIMRSSNPTVAEELDRFSRLSSEMDGEFYHRGDGDDNGRRVEYHPASPILSDIASHEEDGGNDHAAVRALSLPRPARPLRDGSGDTGRGLSASASKAAAAASGITPPRHFLMSKFSSFGGRSTASTAPSSVASSSITTPSSTSFGPSRMSGGTPAHATPSYTQSPLPESSCNSSNYHHSRSNSSVPSSVGSGPVKADEVDELLGAFVRPGTVEAMG